MQYFHVLPPVHQDPVTDVFNPVNGNVNRKLKRSSNIADLASLMAQNHAEEMRIHERMLEQRERHLQLAALRRDELTETASFHGAFLNHFGSLVEVLKAPHLLTCFGNICNVIKC
ncbi:uncharacterized protein KZ484_019671 [Pholidichthys leucotaenia]